MNVVFLGFFFFLAASTLFANLFFHKQGYILHFTRTDNPRLLTHCGENVLKVPKRENRVFPMAINSLIKSLKFKDHSNA